MKGKGQQKIIVEKVNIEAAGQAAIGVYEGVERMLKKNYKALVTANQFDLTTLPICGARTRSGSLCKHKGNTRNGWCKRHGGASTGPINQAFGQRHHRYVHDLRTKAVVTVVKLLSEIDKSLKTFHSKPNGRATYLRSRLADIETW